MSLGITSNTGQSSVKATAEEADPPIHCTNKATRSLPRQTVNIGWLLGVSAWQTMAAHAIPGSACNSTTQLSGRMRFKANRTDTVSQDRYRGGLVGIKKLLRMLAVSSR